MSLTGQGSATAAGVFRAGPAERRAFCADYAGLASAAMRSCLGDFPNYEVRVRGDCPSRVVTVRDVTYHLLPRPADFPADGHLDAQRRWLWRDEAAGEWLDGSVVSGEDTVNSAFDALCPGRRPGAERALIYQDASTPSPTFQALGPTVASAATVEAESTVREILARTLSRVLTMREKAGDDQRFLTPSLYALFMKNAQDFNADPYTGSQEPESYRLVGLSSETEGAGKVVVTARFDIEGLPDAHPRIAYVLVRGTDRWRIDDVRYVSDTGRSMRQVLRRPTQRRP